MAGELNDWLREGQAKWTLVEQHGEITIPWNNPWYRFAGIAIVGLAIAIAGYFWIDFWLVWIIGLGLAGIGTFTAARYFLKGYRVGGIAAFVSKDGCSIGCDYDRLFIPWSAVDTLVKQLPINDQYMLVPIKDGAADEIVVQYQDRSCVAWDRQPYKRAIIRAEYHAAEGVRIYAYPNEIMVFFLSFLYPIIAYRGHADSAETLSVEPGIDG